MKTRSAKKICLLLAIPLVLALLLGVTLAVSAGNEPTVSIEKMNLAFEDNVYLLYAVDVTGVDAPDELGLLIWDAPAASYEQGSEAARLACAGKTLIEGEEYFVFEYTALSAKQMTDDVYARAYITVDGRSYYSEVEKYSIFQYAYNKLGKTGTAGEESLQKMLVQMLEYGAAAQEHFGYKTDRLATAEYYQITVVDGTLPDGFDKGLYLKDSTVALTAAAEKDGKAFGYWERNGEYVGTANPLTVTASGNAVYAAVFGASAPPSNPFEEGTLLFAEDFEGQSLDADQAALLESLGWRYMSGTSEIRVVENGANKQLQISPTAAGTSGLHLELLSDEQFTYLSDRNFTYQYDICYTASSSDTQYIVLLSSYNSSAYDTAHLRYGGKLNNEHYKGNSTFVRYGYSVAASDLLSALFGASKPANLQNISISIRYVMDWESGNKIYLRVNGDVPGATGEWILISQYKASEATCTPDKTVGGGAIVLKAGGGITGYVDNIMIWSGTVETPTAGEPFLTPESKCHEMYLQGDELRCAYCGRTQLLIDTNGWLLEGVPNFETQGTICEKTFYGGQGLDPAQPIEKENLMQIIADSSPAEFSAYLAKLSQNGFVCEYEYDQDGNLFASFVKDTCRVYSYFIASTSEVRVIRESTEVIASLSDFGYQYTPAPGEGAVVYQYALPMRDADHKKANGYRDNGMLYVIKLADNSLVFVDGATVDQFPDSQVEYFMSFLREITGTDEDDVLRVAGWYITHPHGDHMTGLIRALTAYPQYFDLERVFYNINSTQLGTIANIPKVLRYIDELYADDAPQFLRIHTGQVFYLGDVRFQVMHTTEDMVNAKTGAQEVAVGGNDTSSVLKLSFGGKDFLILGDIDKSAAAVLLENWSDESLKVDMLQVAHHVLNVLNDLYRATRAEVLLVPQSQHRIEEILYHLSGDNRADSWPVLLEYADPDRIFYQNTFTPGIAVVDGELTCIYSKPVLYDINASQGW